MTYDLTFYELETDVAATSARIVLPEIISRTHAESVIDIGSGTGAWADEAATYGCTIRAVDLDVPPHLQLVPITEHDLNASLYPCRGWDLAICLEVAEHLDPQAGPPLIAGLAMAGAVLFSAATPGQPGINHINCRPHDYWHHHFAKWGLTPTHVGGWFSEPVSDFYRRNMYLYERP